VPEPAPEQAEIPIEPSETKKGAKGSFVFKPWHGIFFSIFVLLIVANTFIQEDRSYLKTVSNGVEQSILLINPRLEITAKQAIQHADEALLQQLGKPLPAEYKAYPTIYYSDRDQRHFVLKHNGYAAYTKLNDKYIYEDAWLVKYKRFEGSLQERTEEYHVMLDSAGKLLAINHILSEDAALPSLDEAAARAKALEWVLTNDAVILPKLKEISVVPNKLPNRTDWSFTWTDTSDYFSTADSPVNTGEARLKIVISGDQVGRVSRFVFIPEEAQRQIEHSTQLADPFLMTTVILMMIFIVGSVIFAVIMWSKGEFDWKVFLTIMIVMVILIVAEALLNWRSKVGEFSTAQPLANQRLGLIIGIVLKAVFLSAAVALINGWGIWWLKHRPASQNLMLSSKSKLMFYVFIFVSMVIKRFIGWEQSVLTLPSLEPALALCPGLTVWQQMLFNYFLFTGIILFVLYLLEKITQQGKKRLFIVPIVWLFTGLMISIIGQNLPYAEPAFIVGTLISGLFYGLAGWMIWLYQHLLSAKLWLWCSLIVLLIVPFSGMSANAFVNSILAYSLSYLGVLLIVFFMIIRLLRNPQH
jgi:hypothetical protein